ncbi:hypothetical protein ACFL6R_07050 [Gemmatimonadota bacterium]
MTICPETARLTALREGWLDDEDARSLRVHLEVCPGCRAARDDLDAVLEAIDTSQADVEPPPGGYEALLAATLKMRDRIIPIPAPVRLDWRRIVLAVSAVMLVSVTSLTLLNSRSPSTLVTEEVAENQDLPDYILEEHARASDLVPFSDGSTLLLLAKQEKR